MQLWYFVFTVRVQYSSGKPSEYEGVKQDTTALVAGVLECGGSGQGDLLYSIVEYLFRVKKWVRFWPASIGKMGAILKIAHTHLSRIAPIFVSNAPFKTLKQVYKSY